MTTGVGHLSVKQVVDAVNRHWGSGSWQGGSTPEETKAREGSFQEATFLKLDINKAIDLLRWRPLWTGNEAIAQTVLWYRDRTTVGQGFNASHYCTGQVQAYTKQACEQGLAWAQSDRA